VRDGAGRRGVSDLSKIATALPSQAPLVTLPDRVCARPDALPRPSRARALLLLVLAVVVW
jgi:hypothetical protein